LIAILFIQETFADEHRLFWSGVFSADSKPGQNFPFGIYLEGSRLFSYRFKLFYGFIVIVEFNKLENKRIYASVRMLLKVTVTVEKGGLRRDIDFG